MPHRRIRARFAAAPALLAAALAVSVASGMSAEAQERPAETPEPDLRRRTIAAGAEPAAGAADAIRAAEEAEAEPADGAPPPADEPVRDERPAPVADPYAPLGLRVGSFLLFPAIETDTVYSDNVFLSARNARSDRAHGLRPSLVFRSNWSRHELSGEARAVRTYYERFESENDRAHDLLLRGRLDVTRRTNLEGEIASSLAQESRDSSDFPEQAANRPDVETERAAIQGSHRFNRLSLRLRGEVRSEDFGEVLLSPGGPDVNENRDNTRYETSGRAAYEFRPGVSAFAEASVNERRFRRSFEEGGNARRNSTGWEAQAGLAFALSGKLEGEASLGYARQTPNDATRAPIEGVVFDAGLVWRPTALTTVRFSASSQIHETTLVDSSGSLIRAVEAGIEHALRRNLILGAGLAFEAEKFVDSGETSRDWAATLSIEYLLNRYVSIRGEYSYSEELESAIDEGYQENRVRLGVALRR